jgi:hypothetical protein
MELESQPLPAISNDHMPFAFRHHGAWNLTFCRSEPRCQQCWSVGRRWRFG